MPELFDDVDVSEFSLPGDPDFTEPERPRDEQGRFVKAEEVEEAPEETEEPEAPAETPTETVDEEKILGKFKSYDDLERAYLEVEASASRLAQERNEYRTLVEDRLSGIEQRVNQPQVDYQSLVDEDPLRAMTLAAQAGDWGTYQRAKQELNELSPGVGDLYEQNARLAKQIEILSQSVEETRAPVRQQQQLSAVADAYRQVETEFPDFENLRPAMQQIVSELHSDGADWITPALESGDVRQAVTALRTLARSARGLTGENLVAAARDAARQHVEETERAKNEAVVASASATLTDAPPPSAADKLAAQWETLDRSRREGPDGWNI